MKTTLANVINSQEAINRLLARPLPAKTAYKLNKIVRKLMPEFDDFNKIRNDLIKKYGEPTGEGDNFQVIKENMPLYTSELDEVVKEEVEINCNPLTLDDLATCQITGQDMLALDYMIVEVIEPVNKSVQV
jgi:hypothetical protein